MNLKQAKQRIEELERRVKELEARPPQQNHYHYYPHPLIGGWPWWTGQPTWAAGNIGAVSGSTFVISGDSKPLMSDGLQWSGGNVGTQATTKATEGEIFWTNGLGNTGSYKVEQ